jgi:hypothetical protein
MFVVCSDDVKPPSAARFPNGFSAMLTASRKKHVFGDAVANARNRTESGAFLIGPCRQTHKACTLFGRRERQ